MRYDRDNVRCKPPVIGGRKIHCGVGNNVVYNIVCCTSSVPQIYPQTRMCGVATTTLLPSLINAVHSYTIFE